MRLEEIIVGSYLIVAIYHFFLYFLYRKNYSALYFAIICINAVIFNVIKVVQFPLVYKASLLVFLINPITFLLFGNSFFKKDYNQKILKIFLIIALIGISLILVTPQKLLLGFSQNINKFIFLYMQSTIFYLIFYTIKAVIKKRENSILLLIGFSIITFTFLSKLFLTKDMVKLFNPLGGYAMMLIYAFVLARQLSNSFYKSEMVIEKRTKELQTANNDKDKMFALLSHDLRGPIGGIVQALELISDKDEMINNPDMASEFINASYKSATATFQLIENMFLWISMNNGKIVYSPKPGVDLNEIIERNITNLHSISSLKRVNLKMESKESLNFYGDSYMVETVIRNLISNAIKYTDEGGEIKINSTLQGDEVLVEVKDNGIGMNEEIKNTLFSEKVVSQSGTKGEKGSSLGLKLSQEFIEKHKGKIWVESELGVGTSVYFTLPKGESI
ncbi:MAG: hypothetical protein B6I28_05275 [Fusobacteriia bacterium 4572_132]|nr:MAG: hypothetical protein B6I28_05275 [Fusobacteriia bacterium 4572_132]